MIAIGLYTDRRRGVRCLDYCNVRYVASLLEIAVESCKGIDGTSVRLRRRQRAVYVDVR